MSLDVCEDIKKAMSDAKTDKRSKYDILPGDKVELKFIGRVTEVQMNDQDDYILVIKFEDGPNKYDSAMVNMKTINNHYIRKLQYDEFLGDYV